MNQVTNEVTEALKNHSASNTFTRKYMEAVKLRLGIESDYALAKHLCVSRAAVSSYARGRSFFSPAVAQRVADILDLPPALVISAIDVDRSSSASQKELDTRKLIYKTMGIWLAGKTQRGFASLSMMLVIIAISLLAAQAGFAAQSGSLFTQISAALCVLCKVAKRKAKRFLQAADHWMPCRNCAYA